MKVEQKWIEMVGGSKGAIEDFNGFADDKAIVYASDLISELTTALEKIAHTEYCEVSGCCQDTTAKACRKCLANVALKSLGKEECSDKTMCQKCQVDREKCPNL